MRSSNHEVVSRHIHRVAEIIKFPGEAGEYVHLPAYGQILGGQEPPPNEEYADPGQEKER